MKQSPRFLFACATLSVLFVISGCGQKGPDLGKPVNVSGKLTLDGEPLSNVTVNFYNSGPGAPPEFRSFSGTTGPDGSYSIEKVYPADYTVSVQPGQGGGEYAAEESAAEGQGPLAKYQTESPLRATVSESQTTFDFELTSGK